MELEFFKYILVVINATLAIIVNSINLYTGNKKGRLFALMYLAIVLYNIFLLHKKFIIGTMDD
jgi:hypothetical protein